MSDYEEFRQEYFINSFADDLKTSWGIKHFWEKLQFIQNAIDYVSWGLFESFDKHGWLEDISVDYHDVGINIFFNENCSIIASYGLDSFSYLDKDGLWHSFVDNDEPDELEQLVKLAIEDINQQKGNLTYEN